MRLDLPKSANYVSLSRAWIKYDEVFLAAEFLKPALPGTDGSTPMMERDLTIVNFCLEILEGNSGFPLTKHGGDKLL